MIVCYSTPWIMVILTLVFGAGASFALWTVETLRQEKEEKEYRKKITNIQREVVLKLKKENDKKRK